MKRRVLLSLSTAAAILVLVHLAWAAAPTVGAVTATDPINLVAAATKTVWCNATVTDEDGYTNITGVNATLWDSATTTEAAADDGGNHYTNSSCGLAGGSGNSINASCSFALRWFANPATWTCKLVVTDSTSAGSNETNTTVNQLKSISVTSSITFPEQALGSTTTDANERNVIVNNTGNVAINVSVYGYGASESDGYCLVCTVGGSEIPVGNMKYSLSAAQSFGSMTALTSSAVTITDFNLAKGASSTKSVYWKLQIPSSDVGGSCSGFIVITAV